MPGPIWETIREMQEIKRHFEGSRSGSDSTTDALGLGQLNIPGLHVLAKGDTPEPQVRSTEKHMKVRRCEPTIRGVAGCAIQLS